MLPEPSTPVSPSPDDAEFEWLLCLVAAIKVRERPAKSAPESQPPPEPKLRSRLQALLKGLRAGQRMCVT
jgi:hypothetical protein